jgi:Family of unknown function (DUF6165)
MPAWGKSVSQRDINNREKNAPPPGEPAVKAQAPMIPVSWGELLDKITILEIKSRHIVSQDASVHIAEELRQLSAVAAPVQAKSEIIKLVAELKKTNEALWECEDRIRRKEKQRVFDNDFIELARSIYATNDRRAALKRQINEDVGSVLVEEKWYGD